MFSRFGHLFPVCHRFSTSHATCSICSSRPFAGGLSRRVPNAALANAALVQREKKEKHTWNIAKRRLLVNPYGPEIQTAFCFFSLRVNNLNPEKGGIHEFPPDRCVPNSSPAKKNGKHIRDDGGQLRKINPKCLIFTLSLCGNGCRLSESEMHPIENKIELKIQTLRWRLAKVAFDTVRLSIAPGSSLDLYQKIPAPHPFNYQFPHTQRFPSKRLFSFVSGFLENASQRECLKPSATRDSSPPH